MPVQLGRDGTNIALLGKVVFSQPVISKGYVWQKKITYYNFDDMNLTTAFDIRRRNQCVRIAEDHGAAPAELSRLPFPRCHRLTDCTGPIIPNTPSTIKASMGAQCLATGFNAAQPASFNRCCALVHELESILRARTLKIVLQHNPPKSGQTQRRSVCPLSAGHLLLENFWG